ncbi:MAG: hypothetical protein WDZ28_05695 [Simkaniaceae bacterium]
MPITSLFALSETRQKQLNSYADKYSITAYSSFEYPRIPPNEVLKTGKNGKVLIFTYGSLLNKESASHSLSDQAMKTYSPAVALSVKRLFNRYVPTTKKWGVPKNPLDVAMLNLLPCSEPSAIVNGVMMWVDEEDLKNLLTREEGYDLIPVFVISWNEAIDPLITNPPIEVAYTFSASLNAREGIHYTRPNIDPVPKYAIACMKGAAQYGQEYLNFWLYTTYLSDGKTKFICWKNKHLNKALN